MHFIGVAASGLLLLVPAAHAQSWDSLTAASLGQVQALAGDSNGDSVNPFRQKYALFRDTLSPRELPEFLRRHYVTIHEGVYANALEDYRHAESLFVALSRDEPEHPMGPLLRAATLNVEMVDNERYVREKEFWALLDTAETLAKKWVSNHPDDAWGHCCLGHIYGYRAVWEGRFGSWFVALKRGLNARGAYHDALKADSNCVDAYIGLGSYHYWKSAKSEFINWLPVIVHDDKAKGLREMHIALEKGWFTQGAAAAGLVAMHRHRKQYDSALVLAREWQAVYPEGKAFLWGQAYSLFDLRRDAEALEVFDSLKSRLVADTGQGWYNYIEVDFCRAELCDRLGNGARALALMDSVLTYPASEGERKRQKPRLKAAAEYLKKSGSDAN